MSLFRILILAGLVWLVYKVVKSWRLEVTRRDPPQQRFEPMSRCAACGLFLPSQSLSTTGRCGACEKGER